MHLWSFRLAGALLTLSLLVFGTGIALADQDIKMDMSEFKFAPATATFRAGEKVNFSLVNGGQFSHILTIQTPAGVTSDASQNVPKGQTGNASFTFAAPGTYTFWCRYGTHRAQGMEGTFRVVAADAPLPRTGGLPLDLIGGTLAGLGGLSLAGGWVLRRRS